MNPHTIAAAACLSLICAAAHADAPTFTIDPVHSQVFFSASHDGYTNPVGRLRVKSGTFRFDADDWSASQVDATVDIATLDMGDGAWNRKLLTSYFDASNYPTAHYVGTRVEKTGERTGVVHGTLTLLGKTLPVDLQLTFNRAAVNGFTLHYIAGFSATAKFKRSAFGMTRSLNDVGDDVAVRLEIEGERGGAQPAQDEKKEP